VNPLDFQQKHNHGNYSPSIKDTESQKKKDRKVILQGSREIQRKIPTGIQDNKVRHMRKIWFLKESLSFF
jgi:hypothetical protein